MRDWYSIYNNLPDTEKDKIAILRVMECTNGVIQHAFRDNAEHALPLDETREAMKFSMSCMKNMEIPLKEETITFEPETQELMKEARRLYVSGVKKGNAEDFEEFMEISKATAKSCGIVRLVKAKQVLEENVDAIPSSTLNWGLSYLCQFLD
tara:strand:+ start:63221 stop:63676 length:456 start_codon:yes stop_codon:yes gene_type:complete